MKFKLKGGIRYPEKSDRFFDEKGKKDEIAWLHKAFQDFGGYADGYQVGALTLINSSLKDPDLRDYNIYPAVFLIRHYLELRLKEFVQALNYIKEGNVLFPKHHDLQNLWSEFVKKYSEIGEDIRDSRFNVIKELMKEISKADPISEAFRYPVDKGGKKLQTLQYINLEKLKETFIRVTYVFDGISSQLGDFVDITQGMQTELYLSQWQQ